MNYQNTTQIPNILLDELLSILKPSETLILLVILRKTNGWYNHKTKKRKTRDWISYAQFKKKTGLSARTISKGIQTLINLNIIQATTRKGIVLFTPQERKGKVGIFYSCLLQHRKKSTLPYAQKVSEHRQILPITKLTIIKLKRQKSLRKKVEKISDTERIEQIRLSQSYIP